MKTSPHQEPGAGHHQAEHLDREDDLQPALQSRGAPRWILRAEPGSRGAGPEEPVESCAGQEEQEAEADELGPAQPIRPAAMPW